MYPGIDIIEIQRIELACRRHPRIVDRVFTKKELKNIQGKGIETLAGRFAGKEAALKSLGTGLGRLSWHDIEIISDERGEPQVYLSQKALRIAATRGCKEVRLSISHNKEQAVALAVLV